MQPRPLLDRILRGEFGNVRFGDACRLVEAVGFELRRISGSHHIFVHPATREIVNLQNMGGQAKPYQLRQLRRVVERYGLSVEDER